MENDENEGTSWIGRIAAVAALLLATAVAAWLLVVEEDSYKVKVQFQAATNVVKGNLVQVAGRRVGTIEEIELTENGQAELTLKIEDEDIVPLRSGTRATLRIASLSGSANRYVDLRIPPAGGRDLKEGDVIEASDTTSAVDVDQLFQMFDPRTRKGLRSFIRGQAKQWGNEQGTLANDGWEYVNPAVVSPSRLFRELNYDKRVLEDFVVNSSKLVTEVADRRDDLSTLVDQLADMTGAIAREEGNLRDAIDQLPPFMRRANTTFVELRSTLDELAPVVEASKPVTPKLRAVLNELRPFAQEAVPTVRGLSRLVKLDGDDNDLIDLARSVAPLRDVAVRDVERNGKTRPGGFPTSVESLE